jgi:hypothetical protein
VVMAVLVLRVRWFLPLVLSCCCCRVEEDEAIGFEAVLLLVLLSVRSMLADDGEAEDCGVRTVICCCCCCS